MSCCGGNKSSPSFDGAVEASGRPCWVKECGNTASWTCHNCGLDICNVHTVEYQVSDSMGRIANKPHCHLCKTVNDIVDDERANLRSKWCWTALGFCVPCPLMTCYTLKAPERIQAKVMKFNNLVNPPKPITVARSTGTFTVKPSSVKQAPSLPKHPDVTQFFNDIVFGEGKKKAGGGGHGHSHGGGGG